MKKCIKYIIMLILFFCFIPSAFALTYNNMRVSAVLNGGTEKTNINKIEVNYVTISNGVRTKGKVVLSKSDNFTILFPTVPIDSAMFVYALAETDKGEKDIYGMARYEAIVEEDPINDYIDLSLMVSVNSRGYDGERYRTNTDLTDDELDKIKNGDPERTTVTPGTDTPSPGTTNKVTTTQSTETTTYVRPDDKIRQEISDNQKKKNEEKEEKQKKSNKILIIVLLSIVVLIVIIVLVTLVKMSIANNRV